MTEGMDVIVQGSEKGHEGWEWSFMGTDCMDLLILGQAIYIAED